MVVVAADDVVAVDDVVAADDVAAVLLAELLVELAWAAGPVVPGDFLPLPPATAATTMIKTTTSTDHFKNLRMVCNYLLEDPQPGRTPRCEWRFRRSGT